jgi:hypothetical protein
VLDFLIDLVVSIVENTWMFFKLFLSICITFGLVAVPVYLIIVTNACWPLLLFIPSFSIAYTFHEMLCD